MSLACMNGMLKLVDQSVVGILNQLVPRVVVVVVVVTFNSF